LVTFFLFLQNLDKESIIYEYTLFRVSECEQVRLLLVLQDELLLLEDQGVVDGGTVPPAKKP
jgi:hypothetical protein